jgi:hypothetical protein
MWLWLLVRRVGVRGCWVRVRILRRPVQHSRPTYTGLWGCKGFGERAGVGSHGCWVRALLRPDSTFKHRVVVMWRAQLMLVALLGLWMGVQGCKGQC